MEPNVQFWVVVLISATFSTAVVMGVALLIYFEWIICLIEDFFALLLTQAAVTWMAVWVALTCAFVYLLRS